MLFIMENQLSSSMVRERLLVEAATYYIIRMMAIPVNARWFFLHG